MKLNVLLGLLLICQFSLSQTIFGRWITIDDETGNKKGIVEIFEENGKVYGKIIEILEPEHRKRKCSKCEGVNKDKPILGLTIIKGLTKKGDTYDGGEITDPKNGKTYRCKITLDGKDKLIVRGYLGISLFGRSQVWIRQK
ncbi:DUF2147 domain-containing protein [Flavobacterium buctense]|uniref:DUF2147 domain-containing protein n=1 Tax=Flavobacterium buctense TaxID=1648146 RepID=A0ABU9E0T0_9FLAO|nr:DUF2147 domain-containing protein [Flavobacterium buctense]